MKTFAAGAAAADETADEPEPEPAVDYDEYEESEADEDDVLPLGVQAILDDWRTDKERVLLDIIVLYSEDGYVEPPPGYWKVPYDLNKGALGGYVYLAIKTCNRSDPALLLDGPKVLPRSPPPRPPAGSPAALAAR